MKLYKPQKGEVKKMFIDILGSAVVAVILVALGVPSLSQIIDGIGSIFFVFIIFSILFWGIYEQSGGSLSIFAANNLNKDLLGLDPNGVNNSGGAFFPINPYLFERIS